MSLNNAKQSIFWDSRGRPPLAELGGSFSSRQSAETRTGHDLTRNRSSLENPPQKISPLGGAGAKIIDERRTPSKKPGPRSLDSFTGTEAPDWKISFYFVLARGNHNEFNKGCNLLMFRTQ